jgi:predicted transposase YdaD
MHKDITSKQLLKRMAADLANLLLELDIDPESVELLETQHQRVEERRADLVVRATRRGEADSSILHIEIQNSNDTDMPLRMLRYYTDIRFQYRGGALLQYLIYIGKQPLKMLETLPDPALSSYRYHILDMHTVDCSLLLARDTPDALVMAILCDFRERPVQDVVNYIAGRLKVLLYEDERRFGEYFSMLERLAENRNLQQHIKEAQDMLTQVDVTKFASYQWGREDGLREGIEKGREEGREKGQKEGILLLLSLQLKQQLGELPGTTRQRLAKLDIRQLEMLATAVLGLVDVAAFDNWLTEAESGKRLN